jgi:hypothetical protein
VLHVTKLFYCGALLLMLLLDQAATKSCKTPAMRQLVMYAVWALVALTNVSI